MKAAIMALGSFTSTFHPGSDQNYGTLNSERAANVSMHLHMIWLLVSLAVPSRMGLFPPKPQPCQERPVTTPFAQVTCSVLAFPPPPPPPPPPCQSCFICAWRSRECRKGKQNVFTQWYAFVCLSIAQSVG